MPKRGFIPEYLVSDLMAGVVVFLVALPLCLGVPLAARAPLFSGIVAGIVGGIVVGGKTRFSEAAYRIAVGDMCG